MSLPEKFMLTSGELASPFWARLVAHLNSELERCRRQNDATLDANDTATLRGQIKSLKSFIALGDVLPTVEHVDSD